MSVPHALLALLSEGPKYGLRLQNEFESRTGEVWPLNVGQVYTTLQRLERDGLVEADVEGERSQKRYRITSGGAEELAGWLRTPPELVPPPRDELVIKVLVALQIPGIDIREILQAHRRHAIEVMQRYTRIKAEAAQDHVPLALVADAELFRLEAIVRWLDAADVRLKQLPPRAAPAAVSDAPAEPTPRRGGLAMTQRTRAARGIEGLRLGFERGACAQRGRPRGRARRAGGGHGPERLRQEHAVDDRRQPRGGEQRPGARRRRRPRDRLACGSGDDATPVDRLRLPGLQPAPRADGGRERRPAARAGRHTREGRARDGAAGARSSSMSPSAPIATRTSSRAASASGSRSPGRSSASAGCCSPTSRPARWTR